MLEKTILVTGFGPFRDHDINASWQAVQLLDASDFAGYKLVKHEVPVTYDYIDKNIARLWEEHKPIFVLHVGLAEGVNVMRLESLARRKFYQKADASGALHPTEEVCPANKGPLVHIPQIDVGRIVGELDSDQLRFIESTEAGLYLCEYIFYTSMNIDNSRILFTHVPNVDEPYSVEELARGLTMIIHSALEQLDENDKSN